MKKIQTLAVCLCLIISISIFIFGAGGASSVVPVFGNSAVGTYRDQNDANAQSISYFKSTTTGSVTDIVAYISGASSGKAMAALYAVNGNTPGTLLAKSGAVNIGTSFSWVDFQLSTAYTVSSGATYGLAIMGNVPVKIAIVGGSGQRTGGPGYGSYTRGFANPFGTVWFNDLSGAMSIYATGTTSSTPTPTPTPTPAPITPLVPVFGNSAVGTYRDQNDANAQSISYFKSTTTGSVTDIVAYISGASSGKAMAALYAVNGNTPGTLLAKSGAVNIGTSFSWVDFQLSTSYTVTAGANYGLAVLGNVPVNIAIVSGSGQRTGGPGYGSYTRGFTNPFGTVWFNDLSGAMSIYATGTTSSTPTPTPTPTQTPTPTPTSTQTPPPAPPPAPNGNNIAIIPSFFQNPNNPNYGVPNAIGGNPYILYPVTYAGRSNLIEMIPYLGYAGGGSLGRCELDGSWVSVKPGDHIIWKAELYVTDSTVGDTNPWNGGLIGMDAYGSVGRICEIGDSAGLGTYPNNPPDQIDRTIPWGSKTWTTFTYDFIVPKTYVADYSSSYVVGSNVVPVAFIPWFCIWSGVGGTNSPPLECGSVYISNPQLYIISS